MLKCQIFVSDTRQALKLLERIQLHLKDSEAAQLSPSVGDDLNTLISVLDSPVFHSILNIQVRFQCFLILFADFKICIKVNCCFNKVFYINKLYTSLC